MDTIDAMMQTHPRPTAANREALVACIRACLECAQSCTACADACLGEEGVAKLRACIRLNLDCADVCQTTGRLLSRQTEGDWTVITRQIEACVAACRRCGDECASHAHHHEHCRVCAEACRRCEEACNRLLESVAA